YETFAGWDVMMDRYRRVLANTIAPHMVVFETCNLTPDPAYARYGMTSALLEDGYFAFRLHYIAAPPIFDEYSAPLGIAAEPPPKKATHSGIWMRQYTNGMVLVNPSKTETASIDIGAGYRRILGTIDPVVNNGQPISIVTLGP